MTDATSATSLLDDAGRASVATAVMMSHHAMRRDLTLFASALARPHHVRAEGVALHREWMAFTEKLHGHHHGEDSGVFPAALAKKPALAPIIAQLTHEHRLIDPLLDEAALNFDGIARDSDEAAHDAAQVVTKLDALLRPHLALEEEHVLPCLRDEGGFPPPTNDEELRLFREGFAWSMFGIAPHVVDAVMATLPAALVQVLPAERAAFAARRRALWSDPGETSSTTSTPTPTPRKD